MGKKQHKTLPFVIYLIFRQPTRREYTRCTTRLRRKRTYVVIRVRYYNRSHAARGFITPTDQTLIGDEWGGGRGDLLGC